MGKFFKDLESGLKDIVDYKKGKLKLSSRIVEIPEPPADYKAKKIKNIRKKHLYSQDVFAKVLNVSKKTVQSWESGKRSPSHAALRLLEIIDRGIYQPEIYRKN